MLRSLGTALAALVITGLAGCGGGTGASSTPGPLPATPGSAADAARFLEQASFGPTEAQIAQVQQAGITATLDQQLALPSTGYPGYVYEDANSNTVCPATGAPPNCFRDHYTLFPLQNQFFRNALTGPDQLRQRVAFALSQIFVTSGIDIRQPYAMAAYQQVLLDDAFGSYRKLLYDVTLSPAMGRWLDMVNNDKANPSRGTSPNENYGREVLQLFSIGLVQLNPDGTPKLDGSGNPMPTYDQDTVEGFAYTFTGWTFPPLPGATPKWTDPQNYAGQMVPIAAHHDPSAKKLLNGTVLPANQDALTDLNAALDSIANHPNVGPFIGKQLIQFLVTSNPSPAYVSRITAVFNDNGRGQRGDLKAVVRAILLDPEARGDAKSDSGYGRLREPAQALVASLRGVGGNSDGVYLQNVSGSLAQPVYNASSVFNFYAPDYPIPGSATLVGPSFGIFDSATTFARTNVINRLLAAAVAADSSVANSTGTQLDLSSWQALAADPNKVADRINSVFFHGTMSTALRNTIVQTANGIAASDTLSRARAMLYLALSSAQFQVEQ
ncbi:MAG: DUF1800 domain-containing protein [Nevskia sp.]